MISNEQNPLKIQTVNELVTALIEEERTTFSRIIHQTKISKNEFIQYSSWSSESYTRNCIVDNEKFELILLCWEGNQVTPIHDHGGEECWVKIIDGKFKENIFKEDEKGNLEQIKSSIAETGDTTYMIDFMGYHNLENLDKTRGMSLHLYAKPIRECKIYNTELSQFVHKNMEYDTVCEQFNK